MILIPQTFKKSGLSLLLEKKKVGVFLLLMAKILWWLGFAFIAYIWIAQYMMYVWIAIGVAIAVKMILDRKLMFQNF
jgi:hypothetical protein